MATKDIAVAPVGQDESGRPNLPSETDVGAARIGAAARTYDMAQCILQEEIEHEAWFVELLSMERDGEANPAGHFVRGDPATRRSRRTGGSTTARNPEPADRLVTRLRFEGDRGRIAHYRRRYAFPPFLPEQ